MFLRTAIIVLSVFVQWFFIENSVSAQCRCPVQCSPYVNPLYDEPINTRNYYPGAPFEPLEAFHEPNNYYAPNQRKQGDDDLLFRGNLLPHTEIDTQYRKFSPPDQGRGIYPFYQEMDASSVINSESYRIDNHPNWRFINREQCGETLEDRIIGGTEVSLGQYPWIALIGYKNARNPHSDIIFSCGGALINSCWVVSAAHCVTNLPTGFYVSKIRLGEHSLDTDIDCDMRQCAEPTQDFRPAQLLHHKHFNNPKLKHDISLIKLDRPAIFTRWVTPICLPYGNLLNKNIIDQVGEVAGWGIEDMRTRKSSRVLKAVKLPVRSISRCQDMFKKKATLGDTQLCVGGIVGFDSCNGDSGGPLMKVDVVDGTTPKYYVFGLVSFGAQICGAKPTPGVYTKISKYMDWILDNITSC